MTISRPISTAASSDRDTAKQTTIVKPTEAQLRYAQFHHKRRAQAVKYRIDRLHQTPLEVVITIGKVQARESYDGDDGYSSVATEETSDVELKAIRLRRPKISAGRRACLKDSKLMYRRRRRDIREHGYRGYFLDDDQYDEVDDEAKQRGEDTEGDYFASDTNDEQTDNELHHRQRHPRQGGETASDLNEVFATMPKQHSFRQRRRRKRGGGKASTTRGGGAGNDESYQRFQAACHAMMLNIQTSEARGALPSIEVPSKRWTRSKAHVAAAEAQQQTDVYRYKTSGFVAAGRKKSNKNAALLLSYGYFQKNQEAFVMDKGATWLTHLPAKQAKRSKGNTYYFQNMKELPQMIQQSSSFDNNRDDSDGNESTSTLAMRKPGPQKFNRLVAYVQHRLIEKEKEEQQQENQQLLLLDGDQTRRSTGPGQSRTRELAESIETPTSGQATPSRIQQMADSFEGKGGTPRMKLKRQSDTPFSGLTQSSMGSNRRRRGKSRYVPRMRLREFAIEGSSQDDEEGDAVVPPTPLPRTKLSERFSEGDSSEPWLIDGQGKTTPTSKSSSPPRKMKLRDSIAGQSEGQTPESSGTSRTREMALALEGESSNNHGTEGSSKFQQIRDSLEPKNATPKMKLRGEFDRIDEKKAAEDDEGGPPEISRSSVGRLSKQFSSPLAEEQLEDFNRPSREVVHEFSKHIDPRIFEEMQQMEAQDQSSSYGKFRGAGSEKRQSSVSNVSEFFARMREEQQQQLQQPQKQQQGAGKQGNDSFSPADSDKRQSSGSSNVTEFFARIRGEQQQQQQDGSNMGNQPLESVAQPSSPAAHSDAISDLTKESNISGLWNRGRSGISTLTSNLNTIAENQTHKGKSLLSPEVIGRATSGLFNTFRSVPEESEGTSVPGRIQEYQAFQSTQDVSTTDASQENQWEQQDQQQQSSSGKQRSLSPQPLVKSPSMDSHEALEALRGYRKNRASMSPEDTDTASQASSFHPLPDQIREVVQNSGGKSVPPPRYVSPNQSSAPTETTTSPSELSAEQYKRAHQKFLENSANHEAIIDTDDQSLVSNAEGKMDPQVLASLMMSPDILQKRLKQAIGSVEQQRWEQVLFLINANPWLAEMKELTTNQYLLHKLAFFGMGNPPAPMSLSEQLVERFPAAVHKFDQDGNVPLHLASASGNVGMIKMLGDKFSSGASIRNEDGMLPLHFAIASFANFDAVEGRNSSRPMDTIKTVLKLFPQAVAIADNDGNLPLHVAAEFLRGGVGVDIVYLLMDEAERQLEDPYGARFRNKVKIEEMLEDDERSEGTMSTLNRDDSSIMETELQCTMVLNDFGETPLLAAIRGYKGWEMIEALVSGPGGRKAALKEDSDKNNALHLLVGEFQDATAAMSILKIVPETAVHRNAEGILPIEMACMVMMPEEVILSIALVDLPIDIDDRDGIKVRKDRGASWSFLTGDCDDHMVHVVEEILSICSFQQLQELCFLKEAGSEQTILDKATPKCREAMNRTLRFLGRFEFIGDGPLFSDLQTGFKAFDALDFGGNEEGKPVLLECYQNEFDFENRVFTMFDFFLESRFVEEVNVYVEHPEDENVTSPTEMPRQQQQRCVAIERPRITLNEVVQGMVKNGGYESGNADKRLKYSAKICSVLKLIGKSLHHLHDAGVVHGNVCMDTCGKFEDSSWKLLERLGVQAIGKPFDPARFQNSFPPESLVALSAENDPQEREGSTVFDSDRPLVSFSSELESDVSIDIWGFGKICYESLAGKPLIEFDSKSGVNPSDDVVALLQTAEWNVSNMESVFANLLESGIAESGADMITACLFPSPGDRPANMEEILENPFWAEIRKHRSPRKGRYRRSGESVSTSVSLLTDVDRYEV